MKYVSLRKCSSCGGALLGLVGVPWMTCRECPLAWDLFAEPPEKIPTFRPAREKETAPARLPFFLFGLRGEATESVVWVPAYRAPGMRSDGDIPSFLTKHQHTIPLVEAPLGAGVARGPREAAALLPVRTPADLAGDVAWQKLVSLPCRVNGDVLDEPVSGFSIRIAQVLPRPSFA